MKCWCGTCLVPPLWQWQVLTATLHGIFVTQPTPVTVLWESLRVRGGGAAVRSTPQSQQDAVFYSSLCGFFYRTRPNFPSQHVPSLQRQHCGLLLNICWCNCAQNLAFKFYPINLKIIKLLLCVSQKWEPSLRGICINYVSVLRNAFWASPSIHCSSWTSDWSYWEWSARLLSSSDPASPFCKWNYLSLSAPIKPSALVLPTSAECQAVLCAKAPINDCN